MKGSNHMVNKRFKYTCYLAGPIEHTTSKGMSEWRNDITKKLTDPELLIYDPVVQESKKVGNDSMDQLNHLMDLKKENKWSEFFNEMWKIWFGNINNNTDIIQLLTNLRMRKHIDGNSQEVIKYWGDSEAVVRSDFIVVSIPKDVKAVGTIFEVTMAWMYRIPIYLILPDSTNIEANASLLFGVQISNNGKLNTFSCVDDCVKQIKSDYNLK
jgi:hypothetical protein